MTTSDEARSLSYKITIDPKDFERATNDANLWPYRVLVRLFKNFSKSPNRFNSNERTSSGRGFNGNERTSGGRDQGRNEVWSNQYQND